MPSSARTKAVETRVRGRPRSFFRLALTILAIIESLGAPLIAIAAETASQKPVVSTDPADADACRRQLGKIYSAIQEYRKRNQRFPQWLSDLTPELIYDPEALVCPYVQKTGNQSEWKKLFVAVPVFGDPASLPDFSCSYAYEFCTAALKQFTNLTCRDYKQSQARAIGFTVPIVRCLAHERALNLALDGTIYESSTEWENNFVKTNTDMNFFHSIRVFVNASPNEVVLKRIKPQALQTDSSLLDLSSHYNALLLHLSQMTPEGKLLTACPEGLQKIDGIEFDIRGLIHLTGQNFPISFPEKEQDIDVNQKCTQIHFLHGTMFPAPQDSKIATYIVHYTDGRVDEVPILYGKDVKTRLFDSRETSELDNPKVAWVSPPDQVGHAGTSLRLYQKTWKNPSPDSAVKSIDFVSNMTESAPFLVAITLERD